MLVRILLWYWDTFFYQEIHKPIGLFIHRLKKVWRWSREVLWDKHYEFYNHGLYILIRYHLERLQICLLKGYAVQEEKDLKALRISIKIARMLEEDQFEDRACERFYKKWGQPNWLLRSNSHKFMFPKENESNTEQVRAEYIAYLTRSCDKYVEMQKKLFSIIVKHGRTWWD